MTNSMKQILKNAEDFAIKEYYKNMTPETYKEGINNAIKLTEKRLTERYEAELDRVEQHYIRVAQEGALLAMDTLAVEIIYELGNILECYKDEPEYLDQKIDIVQGIYETAMKNIEDYATDKYKNDKQAQKVFKKKKKTIQKVFGIRR